MTQNARILAHLKSGKTLTPLVALDKYGVFRLAARIHDLTSRGVTIKSQMVNFGRRRVARYSLG